MFNTDLKSYKAGSIKKSSVRNALQSLGKTIDCARLSPEWKGKYNYDGEVDIRGLLFVYNHDGEYDKNFYDVFKTEKVEGTKDGAGKIDLANLPISKGQQIHIIEPRLVNYMLTILNDSAHLHRDGKFPEKDYFFHYPDLTLHKAKGEKETRPATIEMISAPYLIIEHGDVKKYDEASEKVVTRYARGFIIYYNESGNTTTEFIYLLDTLSRFQILDLDCNLRIRVAHDSPSAQLRSNFEAAKQVYASDWGFDKYKLQKLQRIELAIVEVTQKRLSETETGWKELE